MDIDKLIPKELGDTPGSPENIKLKDFRPHSVFKNPKTEIKSARYPVIDMHAHAWQKDTDIAEWVSIMGASNIEKTIILSFETGNGFDEILKRYETYPEKFDIWCGFDYTGYDQPGSAWIDHAVAELETCYKKGAKGVGELGDKGLGEYYSSPVPGYGMHLNDSRMKPLLQKSGELGLPISVHIADPIWMYLPMDVHNDGLMNAYKWRIDMEEPGILNHAQLLDTFEDAVRQNPRTVFIACHLLNCTHDLEILGKMLDSYPNLYADITSRLKEIGTVPRYAKSFFEKYQDRLFFGSDLGYDPKMTMGFAEKLYSASFRILESADDHIYEHDLFKYHWPLYGLDLPDSVLQKLYYENARKILHSA
ncbi:MAG: amidohydrolase family protein [Bacteroidota bacterium]